MKKSNTATSTGSASQVTSNKWWLSLFDWLKIWWVVALLGFIFIVAGVTKYVHPFPMVTALMADIIKAIGVIMVVMYVIYTRLLAQETQKMAEASMGLYKSEKGTVMVELEETICGFQELSEDAKKITKEIHLEEKGINEAEFVTLVDSPKIPAISLLIKNLSGRRIEASKIDYKARHTGSDKIHDVCCDINKIGTIGPWEDKKIYLIVAPEGEIEISVKSIDYLDGGIVQRVLIERKLSINRIRIPVKI